MQSMDEIYRRYARTVYQYVLSLTHDADISEEVTQETFYQAVRSIDRFDGSSRITTWLCAIAKNQLRTYQRKHPVTEPLERENEEGQTVNVLDQSASEASAEDALMTETDKVELMKRLHTLKEPYREILYLRAFGSLSFKEIGEVFGKSENWARVTYYRSKEQLRKEMEEHEI